MPMRNAKALVKVIKVYNVNVVQKKKKLYCQKAEKMCKIMVVILEIPTLPLENMMKAKTRIHLRR